MASKKPTLVIAADPGTGISSPTGFAVFEPETKEIHYLANIGTKRKALQHRLRDIADVFSNTIEDIDREFKDHTILVCIEYFVMRGKGGETLQRLIGALMSRLPYHFELMHIQNSKVKLMLAGHGHADKSLVALGVLEYFRENNVSEAYIKDLTLRKESDILDALAIGVAGWQIHQDEQVKNK